MRLFAWRKRVGRFFRLAQCFYNRLVARNFYVAAGKTIHYPYDGVKPMDAQACGKQPFYQDVEPPDMREFMK